MDCEHVHVRHVESKHDYLPVSTKASACPVLLETGLSVVFPTGANVSVQGPPFEPAAVCSGR